MRKPQTFHAVRFYDSEAALCRIVAKFLREGLALGQPALLIATPRHSLGIIAELRARELDVNALQADGTLVVLDVETILANFIVHGVPSAERFKAVMTTAIDKVRGPTRATVRIYSETADLLWKQGRDTVAIQVEILWNKLARSNDFTQLCGCAMGSFVEDGGVQNMCRQHTHLVSADGTTRISNADTLLVGAIKL
jgi:hypothetical protein